MHLFIARTREKDYSGGIGACLSWAQNYIQSGKGESVQILKLRAGEKHGKVVGEITADGLRKISCGRMFHLKSLRLNNG